MNRLKRTIDVENCNRCGGDHDDLELVPFDSPPTLAPYTHWGKCPETGVPLLAVVRSDDTDPLVEGLRSIKTNGAPITVAEGDLPGDKLGSFDESSLEIVLEADQPRPGKAVILFHEFLHAVDFSLEQQGLVDETLSEDRVEHMAPLLAHLLIHGGFFPQVAPAEFDRFMEQGRPDSGDESTEDTGEPSESLVDLVPVDSSNVELVGHRRATGHLFIKFKGTDEKVYRYDDVPRQVYDALLEADSTGSFVHSEIKGEYDFETVPFDR